MANKVDMALILASGMGNRMGELTKDKPKCLLEIDGEILIERQLKQLKSAGIDDIVIMTGYLCEKLEYLKDKFGVKLIYNDEYNTKNTIATLYHARDVIKNKNLYICSSDIYYRENLFKSEENASYYIGAKLKNCTEEWTYETDENDKILGVKYGNLYDYCMIGFSYHTKDMINALMELVEKYYHMDGTGDYYWEDVLVRNFEKLPNMYVRKIEFGSIFEFDNKKDILKYEAYKKAYDFCVKELKISDEKQLLIEEADGGSINFSFKVIYGDKKYILRTPANNMGLLINRASEIEVYKALSKYNISDEVVAINNDGFKISRFFNISKKVNRNDAADLKECMKAYRNLHSLNLKVGASIDIMNILEMYFEIIENDNIKVDLENYSQNVIYCKKVIEELKQFDRPKMLCHGDPSPDNVLFTDCGVKLIDFEYAGIADPISDIALFGVYVDFDENQTFDLYKMYKDFTEIKLEDGVIPTDDIAFDLIHKYMIVSSMSSVLWSIIREYQTNVSYKDFCMDKYKLFDKLIIS